MCNFHGLHVTEGEGESAQIDERETSREVLSVSGLL